VNRRLTALLAVAALAAFWPLAGNGFIVFDDRVYLTGNRWVTAGLTWEGVRWAFGTTHTGNWHPLTWLSHMADVQLFGLRPGPHHLVSLALHLLNTGLVARLGTLLTGSPPAGWVAAGLFLLHPAHVESVAWASERKDLLSALLFLLALLGYRRYLSRPTAPAMGAVLLLHLAGLLAKPMGVTLPLVLLVLDWWPLGRGGRGSLARLAVEKTPLWLASLAAGGITLLAQNRAIASLQEFSLGERLGHVPVSFALHLGKIIWPAALAVFYPLQPPTPATFLASLAVLGALSWVGWTLRGRWPVLLAGWLWFLATLWPVSGLIQAGAQAMADRYTYLTSLGPFLALGVSLGVVTARGGRAVGAVVPGTAVLLLCLGLLTRRQVPVWRDELTLFTHALSVTEGNWLAHTAVGSELAARDRPEEALGHLAEAARIFPRYARAWDNAGVILARQGRTAEAETRFREALRHDPSRDATWENLAQVLLQQGRRDEAVDALREASRRAPPDAGRELLLGDLLVKRGSAAEAVPHYRRAVAASPDGAAARHNLGVTLLSLGEVAEAVPHLREAARLDPGRADTLLSLGAALAILRDPAAEEVLREAVRLDPSSEDARHNLELLRRQRGEGRP
jgi:Flp pilus assembly protein TadD